MERETIKTQIQRYFYQLINGCGNCSCINNYCASSGKINQLTPNEAAIKAIQLFYIDAPFCKTQSIDIGCRNDNFLPFKENSISQQEMPQFSTKSRYNDTLSDKYTYVGSCPPCLNEQALYEILDECEMRDNYSVLIRTLGEVFCSIEKLSNSFSYGALMPSNCKQMTDVNDLNKEEVRCLEGEKDKDEDCCLQTNNVVRDVDLDSVRRSFKALFSLKTSIFENALVNAIVSLAGNLQLELNIRNNKENYDDIVNCLIIIFEIPALGSGDFLETALPAICRASQWLPIDVQAKLARIWSGPGKNSIRMILENLQQLITLRVVVTLFHRDFLLHDENVVTSAVKLIKILYYANMLAGALELSDLPNIDYMTNSVNDYFSEVKIIKNKHPPDTLAAELGIHILDCRKPYIPFSEFYNELLSDTVEMDKDFSNYKTEYFGDHRTRKFSFMNFPFILTPATKMMGLYFDNRIRMYSERRISVMEVITGIPSEPYLKIKVKRDNIINDALVELEMVSLERPSDLKKQLVVEFDGEQGVDEGGVSKEFFQLIIEEIFNPDYGMFIPQHETNTSWFNPTCFETTAQFTLIGIILGLAIYNNIILAVNFPMVLYRKLMDKKGSFEDLQDWNVVLYNSLNHMLNYEEPDFEEVFLQSFRISHTDVFGTIINHNLKENGDKIPVTQENKYEFVHLYADYLLNKSVENQFKAFYKGFKMVVDESPLAHLFRPEEIELLICGSKNFDFAELECSTEYEGGYQSTSIIIKYFWEIVHNLAIEDKKKLLQFSTGSDRVPIGGLSRLKLVIARNGPDSDRLPTAHTCFNVLLLPEYSSKEKLKQMLLKAINYSKGFGMI